MADPKGVTELRLPRSVPPVLALGAFLKNTVCVTRGDRAWLSETVGELDRPENIAAFERTVARLLDLAGAAPVLVAHDLHPDFYSSRYAPRLGAPTLAVQHHHAHGAALAAEHGLDRPMLCLALDGFGLGPGNESWGGELLLCDGPDFRRLGHLAPLLQPGGDVAARETWRMAAAALHRLGRGAEVSWRYAQFPAAQLLPKVMDKGLNSPPTSSAGRLFDAACGLLGVHLVAEFEGQAPMALERMAHAPTVMEQGWSISEDGVLDLLPTLAALVDREAVDGANLFHGTLVAALADWTLRAARQTGVSAVGLGGGCFFNRVLAQGLEQRLTEAGLTVLKAEKVSPGDQGLSLGQAWVAALAAERMVE